MLMFLLTDHGLVMNLCPFPLCFLFSDSIGLVTETKKALPRRSELDSGSSKLEDNF